MSQACLDVDILLIHDKVSYRFTMYKDEEFYRVFDNVIKIQSGDFRYKYEGKYVEINDTPIGLCKDINAELKLFAVPSRPYPILSHINLLAAHSVVFRKNSSVSPPPRVGKSIKKREGVKYTKLSLQEAICMLKPENQYYML